MADRFFRHTEKTRGTAEIIRRITAKTVLEQKLIENNDRILIAASGGKDSSIMAWALSSIRRMLKVEYQLAALHISSDFCTCCKKSALEEKLASWDIPYTDLFIPVISRLKPGKKMNCYWCSSQRRMELLKYAVQNGFNKIALGHHLDDIIETFFMNLCAKGKLLSMPIKMVYDKFPVTLIRPLAFLEERQIIRCADELGILKAACTCPFGKNSLRLDIRKKISALSGNSGAVKRRILSATIDIYAAKKV